MIKTSSGLPRKSSAMFENIGKFSGNVRQRSCNIHISFGESLEIFGKCSEIFGKSSITPSSVCEYHTLARNHKFCTLVARTISISILSLAQNSYVLATV